VWAELSYRGHSSTLPPDSHSTQLCTHLPPVRSVSCVSSV
jgi:hypothetical protein